LDRLSGGCKAPWKDYLLGVLIIQVPGGLAFYEEHCRYRTSLSDVRVILAIIRVFVVKLVCQAVA
jgi:hypothetical protein